LFFLRLARFLFTTMKTLLLLAACCTAIYLIAAQPKFKPIHTKASWYGGGGDGLAGKLTASGEALNPNAMTCACWDVPFGTILKVTLGNRWVLVRVNDRGPNRKRFPDRGIDLTKAAFARLADTEAGLISVKVELHSLPNK
jgi:rare lipoprotein A